MEFKIVWKIDIDADSAKEAAQIAQAIQQDAGSTATVFEVISPDGAKVKIDLIDEPGKDAVLQTSVLENCIKNIAFAAEPTSNDEEHDAYHNAVAEAQGALRQLAALRAMKQATT